MTVTSVLKGLWTFQSYAWRDLKRYKNNLLERHNLLSPTVITPSRERSFNFQLPDETPGRQNLWSEVKPVTWGPFPGPRYTDVPGDSSFVSLFRCIEGGRMRRASWVMSQYYVSDCTPCSKRPNTCNIRNPVMNYTGGPLFAADGDHACWISPRVLLLDLLHDITSNVLH